MRAISRMTSRRVEYLCIITMALLRFDKLRRLLEYNDKRARSSAYA